MTSQHHLTPTQVAEDVYSIGYGEHMYCSRHDGYYQLRYARKMHFLGSRLWVLSHVPCRASHTTGGLPKRLGPHVQGFQGGYDASSTEGGWHRNHSNTHLLYL